MLVYSSAKGNHVYHREQCIYARRIKEEHRGHFETAEEAEEAGYHGCIYCSTLGKLYRKEYKKVQDFCREVHFTCTFQDGMIAIETPIDRWLLVYIPLTNKVRTYHENHSPKKVESPIPGYHNQHWYFTSVYDTVLSIYDHTHAYLVGKVQGPGFVKSKIYAAKGPAIPIPISRRKKGKMKREAKKEKRKHQIGHVLDLIEYLTFREKMTKEAMEI